MGRLIRGWRQAVCICGSVRAGECLHGERLAVWNTRCWEQRKSDALLSDLGKQGGSGFFVGLDDAEGKESASKCFASASSYAGCLYFFSKKEEKTGQPFLYKAGRYAIINSFKNNRRRDYR